jgi:hypothetical protein
MSKPTLRSGIVMAAILTFACVACGGGDGAGRSAPTEGAAAAAGTAGATGSAGGGGGPASPSPGTGGSAGATAGNSNGSQPDAPVDYSHLLYGRFKTSPNGGAPPEMAFSADGTYEVVFSDESVYSNWKWDVSGAEDLPDYDQPWVLQIWPAENVPESLKHGTSYLVVAASDAGFSVSLNGEMGQTHLETYKRVP